VQNRHGAMQEVPRPGRDLRAIWDG
jgi:hypothetical protein